MSHPLMEFERIGLPSDQASLLRGHLELAGSHVYSRETTTSEAWNWLSTSISQAMGEEDAHRLLQLTANNRGESNVSYDESGYDSCQQHRELSKVVSELILIGGVSYESGLLGIGFTKDEILKFIGSEMSLEQSDVGFLCTIAKTYGGRQDFIFPGVTPTDDSTPSLIETTRNTLIGSPDSNVRTITGVGGFRFDQNWNHATDLATFVNLKIVEDKRYYPGMAVFYLLKQHELEDIPALQQMREMNPSYYDLIADLKIQLNNLAPVDHEGVSILCSSYIPKAREIRGLHVHDSHMRGLESNFHSPSYEFMILRAMFERSVSPAEFRGAMHHLQNALHRSWSFNSTIHLPWTSQLASLSNGLIGKLSNHKGDSAVRYGVGLNGQSIEVIKYDIGHHRLHRHDLAGMSAFVMKHYRSSDRFEGPYDSRDIMPKDELWRRIARVGFINAATDIIAD